MKTEREIKKMVSVEEEREKMKKDKEGIEIEIL